MAPSIARRASEGRQAQCFCRRAWPFPGTLSFRVLILPLFPTSSRGLIFRGVIFSGIVSCSIENPDKLQFGRNSKTELTGVLMWYLCGTAEYGATADIG
jgi:hypothetical protein